MSGKFPSIDLKNTMISPFIMIPQQPVPTCRHSRMVANLDKRQILVKLPRSVKPESPRAGVGAIPSLSTNLSVTTSICQRLHFVALAFFWVRYEKSA